jgi:hypothetical protein
MQKWEYLQIYKVRGWEDRKARETWREAGEWTNYLETPAGRKQIESKGQQGLLDKLGEEGWELISISPRSDCLGGFPEYSGGTADIAGFTSQEVWIFKRPKE